MNEKLSIYTFGGLRILDAGEPLAGVESRKIEALFIYLALADRPQPREVLAELLWDDRTQQQAGANLRRVLSGLRKHFGPYVEITRTTAALKADWDLWLDARELQMGVEGLKDKTDNLPSETLSQADEALRLYHGDFLAGFYVRGARNFDSWLAEQRQHWRQVVLDAADRLGDIYETNQLYKQGIDLVRWALQIDPIQESLHRRLMRFLALSGQRGEALKQYDRCRNILAEELVVEPDGQTTALYEQIKSETMTPVRSPSPIPSLDLDELPAFLRDEVEEITPIFVAREGGHGRSGTLSFTGVGRSWPGGDGHWGSRKRQDQPAPRVYQTCTRDSS